MCTCGVNFIGKPLPFGSGLLHIDFPTVHVHGDQHFFHLFPLRVVFRLRVGQRFLAALLHLSHLNQWLARPKSKKMIAESASFGIEANALETVVLRILHVLAVVSCSTLDKRRGIEDAESALPQSLSFANHLTVIVGVQPIPPAVPWHDKDDVPNVGTCRQLHEVVQSGEMGIDPFLHEIVCCVTALLGVACHLLVKPITVKEAVVPKNIVASIRDDNDRWARGSPPLQTFKRVLDALDDVRQPTTPFEIVPDRLAAWWEEVRLLLDVLADVPARRSVPVDHVHKCHRRISGKDEVGLRFPWAYHASE